MHVDKVLTCLHKASLQVDIKSKFSIKKTKFLRFIISTDRIVIDLDKVAVVKD